MTQIARIGQMLLWKVIVGVKVKCKMVLLGLGEGFPGDVLLLVEQVVHLL
jgi:hypothetical protein